jgi:hypothetical protein
MTFKYSARIFAAVNLKLSRERAGRVPGGALRCTAKTTAIAWLVTLDKSD